MSGRKGVPALINHHLSTYARQGRPSVNSPFLMVCHKESKGGNNFLLRCLHRSVETFPHFNEQLFHINQITIIEPNWRIKHHYRLVLISPYAHKHTKSSATQEFISSVTC